MRELDIIKAHVAATKAAHATVKAERDALVAGHAALVAERDAATNALQEVRDYAAELQAESLPTSTP